MEGVFGDEPMEAVSGEGQELAQARGDGPRDSSGKEHIQDIMTDSKPEEGEPRFAWDGVEPMEGVQGDEPMEAASGEGQELAQSSVSHRADCSTLRGLGEANGLLVGSQFKADRM